MTLDPVEVSLPRPPGGSLVVAGNLEVGAAVGLVRDELMPHLENARLTRHRIDFTPEVRRQDRARPLFPAGPGP